MGLDDGAGNRQADAHAVALVGDEGLEQMSRYVRRNPRAGVSNADGEHAVLVGGGRNRELAPVRRLHRLDGIPQQVEQNLLNLHLVGEDEVDAGIELKPYPNALILGADESQSACLLDKLLDAFDPALALAARHEIPQAADDLTRAYSLLRRLVHGIAQQGGAVVGAVFEQASRAFHVVGNRGERLVELVSQRGRHLAHSGQSGDMHELGLQFLKPCLGLLPLRKVADESGEEALIARAHFSHGEFHRKSRAVLALADHEPPDPDDSPLSGSEVALEVAIVILPVGSRHQALDVRADDFRRGKAEQPLGCGAEGLDDPALIDHDHRVGHGIEDRGEVSRARMGVVRAGCRLNTVALELLSAPGNACSDQDECNGVDDFGNRKVRKGRDHEEAEDGAEGGGQQARSQPAETGSDQNRGDEEQIRRIPLHDRGQRHPCNEGDGHCERSHPVPQQILPHQDPALHAAQQARVARFGSEIRKKSLHDRPVGLAISHVGTSLRDNIGVSSLVARRLPIKPWRSLSHADAGHEPRVSPVP